MDKSVRSPETLRSPAFLDSYPMPEDWIAMQGGKPRVFRNPQKPHSPWIVLHVYEEHPDAANRFRSGIIVDTLPPTDGVPLLYKTIRRTDEDGATVQRDIVVPSIMDRSVHGDVCADRSLLAGGKGGYNRIKNQLEYEAYLQHMRNMGMEELRFGINQDGFTLTQHPVVRPAKPLAES